MKRGVIMCLVTFLAFSAKTQGLQEWINQKATQKKYLLQQIAALQIYIEYVEKGYSIAKNGLNEVGNMKQGHFTLDKDFFASLKHINPKVRGYTKTVDIIRFNIDILQQYKNIIECARQSGCFSNDEFDYINKVISGLRTACSKITDNLMVLLTTGKLEMTDDERIRRINQMYEDMQDNFEFINGFKIDITVLSLQRNKELKDANALRLLYGK